MDDRTRIEKDIIMFQENITKLENIKLNNKQNSIIQLAKQYFEDSNYYFKKDDFEDTRTYSWPGIHKSATRKVVRPGFLPEGEKCIIHNAAEMKYHEFNNVVYLSILPTFQLTYDGHRYVSGSNVASLINQYTYRLFNRNYWSSVAFWKYILTLDNRKGYFDGRVLIEIARSPVKCGIDYGIIDDQDAIFSIRRIKELAGEDDEIPTIE